MTVESFKQDGSPQNPSDPSALSAFMKALADAYNGTSVIYEVNGSASGVLGAGDVGVASFALSAEIAAKAHSSTEVLAVLTRHKEHAPEIFELVLLGALLDLANLHLEPAYKLLDGTSTDRRRRAKKEWDAIRAARTE